MLARIAAIRTAWEGGSYEECARLVYELLGDVMGYRGAVMGATTGTPADDPEQVKKELAALKKAVSVTPKRPRAAAGPKGGGGVIAVALIQVIVPLLIDWFKKRQK